MIIYSIVVLFTIWLFRYLFLIMIIPKMEAVRKVVAEMKTSCPACRQNVASYGPYDLCKIHDKLLTQDNPLLYPPMIFYHNGWMILLSGLAWPLILPISLSYLLADWTGTWGVPLFAKFQIKFSNWRSQVLEEKVSAQERLTHARREQKRVERQRETFDVLDSIN